MTIAFNAKPWKTGNSWVVTIPSDFIEHGLISADKETKFTVEEEE